MLLMSSLGQSQSLLNDVLHTINETGTEKYVTKDNTLNRAFLPLFKRERALFVAKHGKYQEV